ncbi:hypothetical protein ACME83_05905 [Enterobacter hormaechei]
MGDGAQKKPKVNAKRSPEVKQLAVAGVVLSQSCLNGLSHILNLPAETLLLATWGLLA